MNVLRLSLPSMLRTEDGATLMEMLVAILTSIVVLGALLAILEFSLNQEASIADRVSSDQTSRLAMSKIIGELQSSCTGFGATAIQKPSTTPSSPLAYIGPTNLWFLSAYGTSTRQSAVLKSVTQHDIIWKETGTSKTGKKLGSLIDYAFPSKAGSTAPGWEFPALTEANATKNVLATDVILPESGSLFQYYKYTESTGKLGSALSASETEAAAAGEEIAKVEVKFTQAAENGDTAPGRTTGVSDAINLRFDSSVAASEVGTSPCA